MTSNLDALARRMDDLPGLTDAWRARDEIYDDDVVVAYVGEPDPAARSALSAEFAEHCGRGLPAAYEAALARFDGMAVFHREPPQSASCVVCPPAEIARLDSPPLWPAEADGDRWFLEDAELFDDATPFVFGRLGDSGWLVLAAPRDTALPCPVYWVDVKFASVPPALLAPDFDSFLQRLCDAALSVRLVLRAAQVKGWCG